VALLANPGNASVQDQINAYVGISNAVESVGQNGLETSNAWWTSTTQAQRDAAYSALSNSSIASQISAATSQFNQQGLSLARAAQASGSNLDPASQSQLALLNQLPAAQQQLVFAGTGSSFGSLDAWKAQLVKDQATQEADNKANPAPTLSVNVTLSDAAKSALANQSGTGSAGDAASGSTNSSSAKAPETLTSAPKTLTEADAALSILKTGEAARTAAQADQNTTSSGVTPSNPSTATANAPVQKPYSIGSRLNTSA
jgi:hypothetical protein